VPVPQGTDEAVTRILAAVQQGDAAAEGELFRILQGELRTHARRYFAAQPPDSTLQPTILIHDAFMKLVRKTDIEWEGRDHFLAVAAKVIRDLVVDHTRRRRAEKRGAGWDRVRLTGLGGAARDEPVDALELEEAMKALGERSERQERIVELRYFGGLTVQEVARVLDLSERSVWYDWRMARAWLRARLEGG